ncbi:MAG: hypothetical protein GY750_11640 [Lentisphaerae bacterium]|nr:hypothetical protein [Lentisphaerota bacterium]MCP4102067.1 hypothetical protein [Lentisphaerota bacterium]
MKLIVYFCGTNSRTPSDGILTFLEKIFKLCDNKNEELAILTIPGCGYYHTLSGGIISNKYNDKTKAKKAISCIEKEDDVSYKRWFAPDLMNDARWLKSMIFSGSLLRDNIENYAGILVSSKLIPFLGHGNSRHIDGCQHFAAFTKAVQQDIRPKEINEILFAGFSRGGVISFILASLLQKDPNFRDIPISVSAIEPVPGNTFMSSGAATLMNCISPVKANNTLYAGDLRECSNIKWASIYLANCNDIFMCQIVPEFHPVTKVQVLVNPKAESHGKSKYFGEVMRDINLFAIYKINKHELQQKHTNITRAHYYDLFKDRHPLHILTRNDITLPKGLSLHCYDKECTYNLRASSLTEYERMEFICDDGELRKILQTLVLYLKKKSSVKNVAFCKFNNYNRAIEQMLQLDLRYDSTIKLLQLIVKEAFRKRGNFKIKEYADTSLKLAKALTFSDPSKSDLFPSGKLSLFEKTKYRYLGCLIEALTMDCKLPVELNKYNGDDYIKRTMHYRLHAFCSLDFDNFLIRKLRDVRYQEFICKLNYYIINQKTFYEGKVMNWLKGIKCINK